MLIQYVQQFHRTFFNELSLKASFSNRVSVYWELCPRSLFNLKRLISSINLSARPSHLHAPRDEALTFPPTGWNLFSPHFMSGEGKSIPRWYSRGRTRNSNSPVDDGAADYRRQRRAAVDRVVITLAVMCVRRVINVRADRRERASERAMLAIERRADNLLRSERRNT